MKITLLGAGAMGSALTFPLAENSHEIRLCGTEYDRETIAALKNNEAHPKLDVQLPETVQYFDAEELEAAIEETGVLLLCVNTKGMRPAMDALLPYIKPELTLVTIAKGFFVIEEAVLPITSGIEAYMQVRGMTRLPTVACMVGPSIARELTRQSPTAVNLSTTADEQQTRKLANAFSSQHFSVEPCQDLKGLEICAAFKNIYSIALSWPLGLGQEGKGEKNGPTNLKAILLLQALDELEQIIRAAGGRPETAHGLAGLGDLVATAGSGRNGSFGKLLGSGQTTAEAMKTLQNQGIHTVEGFDATPQGLRYVETLKSLDSQSLPLLSAIGEVIEGTISPQSFVSEMNLKQYTGHTKYD